MSVMDVSPSLPTTPRSRSKGYFHAFEFRQGNLVRGSSCDEKIVEREFLWKGSEPPIICHLELWMSIDTRERERGSKLEGIEGSKDPLSSDSSTSY